MSTQSSRSRLTALGCMVLTAGLLLPANAFAQSAARPTPVLDAARAAASREAGLMKERRAAQTTPAPTTDLRSGSFFKSKAGVAALVIVVVGTGYALYSASSDRIKSTGR